MSWICSLLIFNRVTLSSTRGLSDDSTLYEPRIWPCSIACARSKCSRVDQNCETNDPDDKASGFVCKPSKNIRCRFESDLNNDCCSSMSDRSLFSSSKGLFDVPADVTAFAIAIAADRPSEPPLGPGVWDGVADFAELIRALNVSLMTSACGRASAPAVN